MTSKQFRDALAKAGLSQMAFARLINRDPRTVRRWIRGEHPLPKNTEKTLRLLLDGKITVDDLQ